MAQRIRPGRTGTLPAPGIRVLPSRRAEVLVERTEVRKDRAMESDVLETISAHTRLRRIADLGLWVDGGVVHLRGLVENASEQALLRRVVALVRGVYAVWDLVERPDRRPLRIADIGCGNHKQVEEGIGVDRLFCGPVEVIADLEEGLPFADCSLDHIFAVHVLEHVVNLVPLMNDIHRVLREDGVLHVMAPYWRHSVAVADPTHVRFFAPETFRVFCERREGVRPYRPLIVSYNSDTVFADLSPDKLGAGASDAEIVRCFP